MTVVLDANVLIAAYAARGLCHAVFEACLARDDIVLTRRILTDVRDKLVRKIKFPPREAEDIATFLGEQVRIVMPEPVPERACRDPDDRDVLGAAIAGRATFIITGDEDLLVLQQFEHVRIVTPRAYWEACGQRPSEERGA